MSTAYGRRTIQRYREAEAIRRNRQSIASHLLDEGSAALGSRPLTAAERKARKTDNRRKRAKRCQHASPMTRARSGRK